MVNPIAPDPDPAAAPTVVVNSTSRLTPDGIRGYSKAITGAITSGATALIIALPDGITAVEWVMIVGALLAGAGLVAAVPNAVAPTRVAATDVKAK